MGFFSVSLEVVEHIVKHCRTINWPEPLFAYLVLRKCAKEGTEITTAGVPAIAKTLGITHYKAELALKELQKIQWGCTVREKVWTTPEELKQEGEENIPSFLNGYPVKVVPLGDGPLVYLSNALVDGVGNGKRKPPIRRLVKDVPKAERLDTANLLLHLYAHDLYADFGGINPTTAVFKPWTYEGECYDGEAELGRQGSISAKTTTLYFWLVSSKKDKIMAQKSFIESVTEGDSGRFWAALKNLRELDLFYDVAMVFDEDPMTSPGAEILYTLYVFDRYTREKAKGEKSTRGGLWRETFEALDRSEIMENRVPDLRMAAFREYELHGTPSGVFVYAAPSPKAVLITVFRLRYPALTEDFALGLDVETTGNQEWKDVLNTLDGFDVISECSAEKSSNEINAF